MTFTDAIKGKMVKARHGDKSHRILRQNKTEVVFKCNSVIDGKNRRITDKQVAELFVPGDSATLCVGCR
jgi:hypothetical protein